MHAIACSSVSPFSLLPLPLCCAELLSDLAASAEQQLPALTETYKHLHRNPELSQHEEKTSAFVAGGIAQAGLHGDRARGQVRGRLAGLRRGRDPGKRRGAAPVDPHGDGCAAGGGEDRPGLCEHSEDDQCAGAAGGRDACLRPRPAYDGAAGRGAGDGGAQEPVARNADADRAACRRDDSGRSGDAGRSSL